MNDLELLEKYEPVLRFAKSERFFPMAVEPYLAMCKIFPSGPKGAVETISHLNEALVDHMGELQSEQFYLRFVNDPLRDFDAWVWWGIGSVLGAAVSWWLGGDGIDKGMVFQYYWVPLREATVKLHKYQNEYLSFIE